MVLTGDGLAMSICLPGVTRCLLIGLKWVNSVSIELLLQLLVTSSAFASDSGTVATGEAVGGWVKAEVGRI